MISCDRCSKDLGRASLDSQTYAVVCEKPLESREFYTPKTGLTSQLQLCSKCHEILCSAVVAAIRKCLKSK